MRSQPRGRILSCISCRRSCSTSKGQPAPTEGPSPSHWTPAHEPGQNLLYDMALKVIEDDSKRLRAKMEALPNDSPTRKELEVLAEMNRPEVLWAAGNGTGTYSPQSWQYSLTASLTCRRHVETRFQTFGRASLAGTWKARSSSKHLYCESCNLS